jgi:Transmembrane secretion effector
MALEQAPLFDDRQSVFLPAITNSGGEARDGRTDRRKLILYCEFWMLGIAILLTVATIGGFVSPWLLLAPTFALSAGDAIATPTWRAVLPWSAHSSRRLCRTGLGRVFWPCSF